MVNIDELRFDEKGLIPAVVVDTYSKKVLTVAYMNKESLAISMKEGRTCFWSRSRQELWRKGETSGNVQHIVSITADCDRDALTVEVEGRPCLPSGDRILLLRFRVSESCVSGLLCGWLDGNAGGQKKGKARRLLYDLSF